MFRTIAHTFELMRMSWNVLMLDRELLLFPLMSGLALALLGAATMAAGVAAGEAGWPSTDGDVLRASDILGADGEVFRAGDVLQPSTTEGVALDTRGLATEGDAALTAGRLGLTATGDAAAQAGGLGPVALMVIGASVSFLASTIVIFFNAALIAAALERLRGGDPSVASGLRAASARLPALLAWAVISTVVTVALRTLGRHGGPGGVVGSMLGGIAWSLMTFFVVPVLVAERVGPMEAVRRSSALLRETWGRQAAATFGFGVIGVVAVAAAAVPAALLFMVHPVLGAAVGVPLVATAIGAVQALEGIFRAALYDYARGDTPHGFDRETLEAAYHPGRAL